MTVLEFARRRKRWSQRELGDLVGINQTYISQFERGLVPGADQRERLARVLDVPADSLLDPVMLPESARA
jgi:transcriptional regulator with XRE-family HTH domain